jgi:hypothetical protein
MCQADTEKKEKIIVPPRHLRARQGSVCVGGAVLLLTLSKCTHARTHTDPETLRHLS